MLDLIWTRPEGLVATLLVACRLAPTAFLVPLLGGPRAPLPAKLAIVAGLSLLLSPVALTQVQSMMAPGGLLAPSSSTTAILVGLGVKEILVGTAIAVLLSMVFFAAQMAGALVDAARGDSRSQVGTGAYLGRVSPLSAFYVLLATVVFFALNGHHLVIGALRTSFEVLPLSWLPGAESANTGLTAVVTTVLSLGTDLFAVALLLALPVLAAVLLVELLLGMTGRMVPRLHLFFLGLPLRSLVAIFMLMASLAAVTQAMAGHLSNTTTWIDWFLEQLGATG